MVQIDSQSSDRRGKEGAKGIHPGHPLSAASLLGNQRQSEPGTPGSKLTTDLDNARTRQTLNELVNGIYPRDPAASPDPLASLQQADLLPQCLERHGVALIQSLSSCRSSPP